MVAGLGLGGGVVAEGLVETLLVVPVGPVRGRVEHVGQIVERAVLGDAFGLVLAVDGLGRSVFVRVADAAGRRADPGDQGLFLVGRGRVLAGVVAVADQPGGRGMVLPGAGGRRRQLPVGLAPGGFGAVSERPAGPGGDLDPVLPSAQRDLCPLTYSLVATAPEDSRVTV